MLGTDDKWVRESGYFILLHDLMMMMMIMMMMMEDKII